MSGKPHVMIPVVLEKLKAAYTMWLSDVEACLYCELSTSTLSDYCQKHPEFRELKEILRNNTKMTAKVVLHESICNTKLENRKQTIEDSKWYLERKAKDEFSTKEIRQIEGELKIDASRIKEMSDSDLDKYINTTV